jgi:hypothetical protein
MGFMDGLKSIFGGGAASGESGGQDAYWIHVRCNRCGELIRTRVDLRHDLNPRDEGGFMTRKVLIGSQRCFEKIEVVLHFDQAYKVSERQIDGGEFVTAEEYAAEGQD